MLENDLTDSRSPLLYDSECLARIDALLDDNTLDAAQLILLTDRRPRDRTHPTVVRSTLLMLMSSSRVTTTRSPSCSS